MKKIITAAALLLSTAGLATAQTTATNFTAPDCNSTSHTLFNELDNGEVIVIAWVMPCPACVGPSKAAYNAVQSFATSHPGKVKFYLVDDYGDASCSILSNWVTANNIGNLSNITIFDNDNNPISMSDYGTDGMPKVVVLGGSNHQIHYNQNNAAANNVTAITAAINTALIPTGINDIRNELSFAMTPNPTTGQFSISYAQPVEQVIISTVSGQVLKAEQFAKGTTNPVIDLSTVAAGIYMVKIVDAEKRTGIQKLVKQ